MKITQRLASAATLIATTAVAAPALAHPGHGPVDDGLVHWLSSHPVTSVAIVAAVVSIPFAIRRLARSAS